MWVFCYLTSLFGCIAVMNPRDDAPVSGAAQHSAILPELGVLAGVYRFKWPLLPDFAPVAERHASRVVLVSSDIQILRSGVRVLKIEFVVADKVHIVLEKHRHLLKHTVAPVDIIRIPVHDDLAVGPGAREVSLRANRN